MSSKLLLALFPAFLIACGGGDDDSGSGNTAGTGGATAATGGGAGTGGSTAATGGTGTGGGGGTMAGSGGSVSGSGGMTAGSGGAAAGMGGSAGAAQCGSNMLTLADANNYAFTSNITLIPTKMKANDPDLTFDWSGLNVDFLGHTTSPTADIDSVLLVELNATLEQFEKSLNDDNPDALKQYAQGPLQLITNNALTSANLQDFGVPGQPQNTYKTSADVKAATDDYLDPAKYDPASHIFAVMPSKGTNPGTGSRMIQIFTVDTNTTTKSLAIMPNMKLPAGTNGHTGGTTGPSMSVTYDVHLQTLTPIKVAAGDANLTIDWRSLTKNGLGRAWVKRSLSRIIVGHYTQSLTDLENQFLDIESLPTASYVGTIPDDNPLALSGLKEKTSSAAFTGIDNTGVWIMALFCDPIVCGNPAPWFLTILQTCN